MATGRVATVAPGAAAIATIYTVPIGYYGIYNISITNTNATPVTIRLAVAAGATPNANEYIEYNATIVPQGVLERTGIVAGAGVYIVGYASNSLVNFNVWGIETSTS
jgi:hypothetical protein